MERKVNGASKNGNYDSGYDTPNPLSPAMTGTSTASGDGNYKGRFDGRHLYAGHANTLVPTRNKTPEEIVEMERQLKEAAIALGEAGKKQVKMARELQLLMLEKEEVETMMGIELQGVQERVATLEALETEVEDLRAKGTGASQDEIEELRKEWDAEREEWERERGDMQDEKMDDLARLQDEMDALRQEDAGTIQDLTAQLDEALNVVQGVIRGYDIPVFSRDTSLKTLLGAVEKHLGGLQAKVEGLEEREREWEVSRKKLEEDVRGGMDKREALFRDLEEARKEVRALQSQSPPLNGRTSVASTATAVSSTASGDAARLIAILQPLWTVLPSPEQRAAKFANQSKFRTGSPTPTSPTLTPSSLGLATPTVTGTPVKSLSDLDVRSLKSLYTPEATRSNSLGPASPTNTTSPARFTVEGFAERVKALIADDRLLIERLIRFAQAHELLKKNAERAQKLAAESSTALETYQRQVRMLETRLERQGQAAAAAIADGISGIGGGGQEVGALQATIERLEKEKRDLEMRAGEQGETCRQLTEANNALSAKTLALAEEAASAPEMVRRQMEAQLVEVRRGMEERRISAEGQLTEAIKEKRDLEDKLNETMRLLDLAREEVDGMRAGESRQRVALLDELNSMQTENGQLRAQLRAFKK